MKRKLQETERKLKETEHELQVPMIVCRTWVETHCCCCTA